MFTLVRVPKIGYPIIEGGEIMAVNKNDHNPIFMKSPKGSGHKTTLFQKKDYTKQFNEMQRDLRGSPREDKIMYYKDFYKAIAKAADQRLVNLERLSRKEGYEHVLEWSYRLAMHDIKQEWGSKAKRFNRKLPDDLRTIYKDINKVLQFMESPTSSKQGIDEVYLKRAQTITDRYGVKVNWQNIASLFESKLYTKTDEKKGSKTVLKAIGFIQRNTKSILKALDEGKSISVRLGAKFDVENDEKKHLELISSEDYDREVEKVINLYLQYYKKDVKSLFKGF